LLRVSLRYERLSHIEDGAVIILPLGAGILRYATLD